MNTIAAILPMVFRVLGLSSMTPWALKILPYIVTYGPSIKAFLDSAKVTWDSFKSQHPAIAAIIEKIASRLFPNLPAQEAARITLKGIFSPHRMTKEEEEVWNRRADGTSVTDKDLGDFPRDPS